MTVVRHIEATPQAVWDVLSDHEGMPKWTPLRRVTLEPAGATERNGTGAIRVLRSVPGYVIREEITRFEPPRLLGYSVRAGLPTRDHHGEIAIAPDHGGSVVTWTISFTSAVPGMRRIVTGLVVATLWLLARHVERRH